MSGTGIKAACAAMRTVDGRSRMPAHSLRVWGVICEFERDGNMKRDPVELFGGMTNTMQADMRRLLPQILPWLHDLDEVTR